MLLVNVGTLSPRSGSIPFLLGLSSWVRGASGSFLYVFIYIYIFLATSHEGGGGGRDWQSLFIYLFISLVYSTVGATTCFRLLQLFTCTWRHLLPVYFISHSLFVTDYIIYLLYWCISHQGYASINFSLSG